MQADSRNDKAFPHSYRARHRPPQSSALRSTIPDMSLRFRRRIQIAPGIHLNLGLHGAGLSVGPRGLHVGLNRQDMYTSAGIPGTGLYAIHHVRNSPGEHPNVEGDAAGCVVAVIIAAVVIAVLALLAMSQH